MLRAKASGGRDRWERRNHAGRAVEWYAGPAAALAVAAAMGAAAAVLPDGLGERTMLGDTGAHALGAALGASVVAGAGRAGLVARAAALVAAAVYGDRVSAAARSLGGSPEGTGRRRPGPETPGTVGDRR
ncbi:hypothetical protein SUDANB176_01721 [Streptomyces sp. enrichment culture]